MFKKIIIKVPKEIMRNVFNMNQEYVVECKTPDCPFCARRDKLQQFDLDLSAKIREIALGHKGTQKLSI